jgi:fructokinase
MPTLLLQAGPVLVVGEALVDEFQDVHVAGGAPFNVARSLAWLGCSVHFVSRIGVGDAAAGLLLESARRYGLSPDGLQRDPDHATGRVSVHEGVQGGHQFEIHADAAWDHLAPPLLPAGWDLGWLYLGSLIQRSPQSRATVRRLAKHHRGPVFLDLNLRPGTDQRDLASESLMLSDWVKVNEDELALLLEWFSPGDLPGLMRRFALDRLVLTRGAAGFAAYDSLGSCRHEGGGADQPRVQDTVGAGDAFTAMLLAGLSLGRPIEAGLELANRYASHICGLRGPLPADPQVLASPTDWRAAVAALPAQGRTAQVSSTVQGAQE